MMMRAMAPTRMPAVTSCAISIASSIGGGETRG